IAANMSCLSTASYGSAPDAAEVADVADSTITSPKIVSSSAVDEMSRNSLGTGANTRPSEMRAARPLRGFASGVVAGGRVCVVLTVAPSGPGPHRFREPASSVRVRRELIERCGGRSEQDDIAVLCHLGRELDHPRHDILSLG